MKWVSDPNCPEDTVYMWKGLSYPGQAVASEGVIWEPGVNALEVAGKAGWMLSGTSVNGEETIWHPTTWTKTWGQPSKDVEANAWVLILENALSGCPVALSAMRQVVTTNEKYAEFKESLDVLSEDAI